MTIFDPPPRRGRPRNPPIDESKRVMARRAGFRAGKRSDGWVVITPWTTKANAVKAYPNAYLAWNAAYEASLAKWVGEIVSPS